MYVNGDLMINVTASSDATYFDSFARNQKIYRKQKHSQNIFRIQEYDSVVCGYFCIRFIDFMLKVKVS